MKEKEVRDLTEKDRQEKMDDISQEYFNLKFQLATGKIEAPWRLKFVRRDIARIKTIAREYAAEESAKKIADKA